jgi:hypothetical protein
MSTFWKRCEVLQYEIANQIHIKIINRIHSETDRPDDGGSKYL